MISFLSRKALSFSFFVFAATSVAQAQPKFFEIRHTPYDRQMLRVGSTLGASAGHSIDGLSFALINQWMIQLRAMPYHYSREWRTPSEVEATRVGDCKGKALALYHRMQLNGARNLRLVIGKRRAIDWRTHAWLEWETTHGTVLLDPTFNWGATAKKADPRSYIAFYGYEGRRKYQASTLLLAKHQFAARGPAAPAHGVINRPAQRAKAQTLKSGAITSNILFNRTTF
jgi:hypothetical protein